MPTSSARTLKGPRRLQRRRDRRSPSPQWQFLRGFLKNPVMVGSIIPSSRVLIDKMLEPGRLGEHQAVRRIWPGRRHLHPADARAARARRDAGDDRHQRRLHPLPEGIDRRSAAGRGHRLGRRRREDPRRPRPRLGRLCAFRPALLDPSAGRRRRHRRGDRRRSSARAARSWSISSAPRCSISSSRISSRSSAASNGSTCRRRPCSGPIRASRRR